MEGAEHAAHTYTKAKSIVYSDIKVVNYIMNREDYLFAQSDKT